MAEKSVDDIAAEVLGKPNPYKALNPGSPAWFAAQVRGRPDQLEYGDNTAPDDDTTDNPGSLDERIAAIRAKVSDLGWNPQDRRRAAGRITR